MFRNMILPDGVGVSWYIVKVVALISGIIRPREGLAVGNLESKRLNSKNPVRY
jgi:hypothetical protein